jgi:hypothetical protein
MKTYLEPEEVERLEQAATNLRGCLPGRLLSHSATAHRKLWLTMQDIDLEADDNYSAIKSLFGEMQLVIKSKG